MFCTVYLELDTNRENGEDILMGVYTAFHQRFGSDVTLNQRLFCVHAARVWHSSTPTRLVEDKGHRYNVTTKVLVTCGIVENYKILKSLFAFTY